MFAARQNFDTGFFARGVGSAPHGVAIADFNNDGRRDVATANLASDSLDVGGVSVLINAGISTPLLPAPDQM